MTVILNMLFGGFISGLIVLADDMLKGLWDVVFNISAVISNRWFSTFISGLSNTFYTVAVLLLIIKFLKKMFDIYVLWSDGDPDAEPVQLVINFVKAMVTAVCFPYIWDIFVQVGKEILDKSIDSLNTSGSLVEQWGEANWTSLGIIPTIFSLIFIICVIIMYFQFIKRGLELTLMIIGVPLACIGLLDNDHGIFRPYCNQFSKILISSIFQVIVAKLGLSLALSTNIWDGSGMSLIFGIGCMALSLSMSLLLQEFMIPRTNSGGPMSKIYSVTMMSNLIKNFAR